MPTHQEKEFKWDASQRNAFARFKHALQRVQVVCAGTKQCLITDVYLDNHQQEFTKHKMALRIRCVNKKYEATLKTRTAIKNGLAVRKEFSIPLPASCRKHALACLAARSSWKGMKVTDLYVRFVIRNHRQFYALRYGRCWCEAALDNYVTYAGGRQLRRKEIELELKRGSSRDFEKLIQKLSVLCELPAAKISKVAGAEQWIKQKLDKTNF